MTTILTHKFDYGVERQLADLSSGDIILYLKANSYHVGLVATCLENGAKYLVSLTDRPGIIEKMDYVKLFKIIKEIELTISKPIDEYIKNVFVGDVFEWNDEKYLCTNLFLEDSK